MKVKIITAIIGLTVTTIVPVYADGIQSPRGISQSAWNASSTYQDFQCPSETSRGEGVDMNYTSDRSDDFYFVTCNAIEVYMPRGPLVSPIISDTSTVTTEVIIPITNAETITATVDTPLTISSNTNSSNTTNNVTPTLSNTQLITLILELFNKIIALLTQLK
jgi:hypothetical protein